MALTKEIKASLDKSILCWLATSSPDNMPNVSPKEVFCHYLSDKVIIANIASPGSVKNIRDNSQVCLSVVDVFVQKGYQLKGSARIVESDDQDFSALEEKLLVMTQGKYPFSSITEITIHSAKPIIAPSYLLYPEITEAQQIAAAKKAYGCEKNN